MTIEQIFLLVLLGVVLALFVWGRYRYDLIAVGALLAVAVTGLVPTDELFDGFGHPATLTVAFVLIVSRGLQNSGAVELIARNLIPPIKNPMAHIGAISGVAGGMSAIMNNVGALALLMPAAIQSARDAKRSPSMILMPLSFGSILGGLITLIGTPPNIIVATFRQDYAGDPFKMFDFTPVGLTVAVVGIIFVAVLGWRLVPGTRTGQTSEEDMFDIDNYVFEAKLGKKCESAGKTIGELDNIAGENDAVVLGLIRRGRKIGPANRRQQARAGDIILLEAAQEKLEALSKDLDLKPTSRKKDEESIFGGQDVALMEAAVPPRSRITGRTVESLRLPTRFGVNLIAVSRSGQPFRGRLKNFRFRAGDVFLLEGDAERLPEVVSSLDCLPLAQRGLQRGQWRYMGFVTLGIFAGAIAAATLGFIPLIVGLLIAAAAMVVLNVVPPRDIYDSVDWPVVVLLGAMIPVGSALETTGTTALLADSLVGASSGLGPLAIMVLIMVLTMTLSDIMNNAATAVVMAPLGATIARQLGVSPDPFLMAVAVGASCAFLTPIGHQNNTLILGPGGYKFGDYWRMGLPLEVLIVLVATPMIMIVWPF